MLFYSQDRLYFFLENDTILFTSPDNIEYQQYLDIPCLLDMDLRTTIVQPLQLIMSGVFLLQATSPNPKNTRWTKQRMGAVTFVLNPPNEEEIIKASVYYYLFLH